MVEELNRFWFEKQNPQIHFNAEDAENAKEIQLMYFSAFSAFSALKNSCDFKFVEFIHARSHFESSFAGR